MLQNDSFQNVFSCLQEKVFINLSFTDDSMKEWTAFITPWRIWPLCEKHNYTFRAYSNICSNYYFAFAHGGVHIRRCYREAPQIFYFIFQLALKDHWNFHFSLQTWSLHLHILETLKSKFLTALFIFWQKR